KWPKYIASISGSRLGNRRSFVPKTARMWRRRLCWRGWMGFFGIDNAPPAARNTISRLFMRGGIRWRAITSASAACSSAAWPRPDQDRAGPRQLNIGRADAEATKNWACKDRGFWRGIPARVLLSAFVGDQ